MFCQGKNCLGVQGTLKKWHAIDCEVAMRPHIFIFLRKIREYTSLRRIREFAFLRRIREYASLRKILEYAIQIGWTTYINPLMAGPFVQELMGKAIYF